jgi:hypothetical protein
MALDGHPIHFTSLQPTGRLPCKLPSPPKKAPGPGGHTHPAGDAVKMRLRRRQIQALSCTFNNGPDESAWGKRHDAGYG